MKTLKESFLANHDHCGQHSFELVKRTDSVAMYKRTNNGRVFGYEVFKIKLRLKGQPFPNGSVESEDRECYPGTSSFGKTAWFFPSESVANIKYDLLVNGPVTKAKMENVIKKSSSTGKRGRPKKTPVNLSFPDSEFTLNDLIKINSSLKIKRSTLYIQVRNLVKCDVINIVGETKSQSGRGKPMKVYQKIK
jgi:hypothetical protein